VPPACKGAAVAATDRWRRPLRRLLRLLGGLLAAGPAVAGTLPEDRAEAMFHVYDGGGVKADGPALLVRKSIADKVSLSGSYYVDSVSNASIDVVTTASPFKERRTAYDLGLDYVYRDASISLSASSSSEPDYTARSAGIDIAQEVFGGMTTVSMGFTRGSDTVQKRGDPGFEDEVTRWQYRVGLTQILSPRWLMSANFEAISDDGFLGSPYRVALVFGAAVPERNPRTRSSRAIKLRTIGDVSEFVPRSSVRAEYRYFWDNWDIAAHTLEFGASHYFGQRWLADAFVRTYTQSSALFFSDNATSETTYISRNRQLSDFTSLGLGAKASYTVNGLPARYDVKVTGGYEFKQFKFNEFTDLRSGKLYEHNAHVLQLYVSANF
jgi:Protein of unknown function (DUF3570)